MLIGDPLKVIRKKMMRLVLELIISKPEREDVLLQMLINKLGDPDVDISNFAIKLVKELQAAHHRMSLIILTFVEKFLTQKNLTDQAQFYAIVYLSQMQLVNDKEFIEAALKFFFELFNSYADKEDEKYVKYIALIIKTLNQLCKFSKENNMNLKAFFEEKLNVLFRLSHSKSLRLRYQVLKLVFYMSKNYDMQQLDRYYKSLYDMLLSKDVATTKYIKEIFLLLLESLNYDTNNTRVAAFLKRLLQSSFNSEPSFVACTLMIVSQTLRNKNKLWKIVDKPQAKENEYDASKREPQFTHADTLPLYELSFFTKHYHPTIKTFAEHILLNYNKSAIDYPSDPIIDFSLVNFLDKFILKNPESKTKREMKKLKKREEDEEKIPEEEKNQNDLIKGKNIEFIKHFNNIDTKPKKKLKDEKDMHKFADDIMDKEYAKLVGGIDEDVADFDEFEDD